MQFFCIDLNIHLWNWICIQSSIYILSNTFMYLFTLEAIILISGQLFTGFLPVLISSTREEYPTGCHVSEYAMFSLIVKRLLIGKCLLSVCCLLCNSNQWDDAGYLCYIYLFDMIAEVTPTLQVFTQWRVYNSLLRQTGCTGSKKEVVLATYSTAYF